MDAIVGGKVITPRVGCPVEVNALWYNALKIYENFCEILNVDIKAGYLELIAKFELILPNFLSIPKGPYLMWSSWDLAGQYPASQSNLLC